MKVYVLLGLTGNLSEVDGAMVLLVTSSRERAEREAAKSHGREFVDFEVTEHEVED